ncbi:hypothetical protein HanHA300_Chr06g0198421 [Helianthus annuus]|nr:hypothetical protein HanHA300_Chr06g0198421 [Helianthus annuus]KAJ0572201.1 hypothetical protein HanHA89_Chr06g0213181 [Helianthus annuus]KAJ0736662.1 hypothetical protein HanLR1_Chr06g0198421 [Helianthus annuus]
MTGDDDGGSEDTRRRWWPPPELPSSSNLVLVLRFRFQILFGTASGVTDQIQERSTVNPVKISSFGCRFSGLFGLRFGSSSFVTGSGLVSDQVASL